MEENVDDGLLVDDFKEHMEAVEVWRVDDLDGCTDKNVLRRFVVEQDHDAVVSIIERHDGRHDW